MGKLFARIFILASVGLAVGCQTGRDARSAAGTGASRRDKMLPSQPSQGAEASSDIGRSGLIPREQTQKTLNDFPEAYLKLGSPRLLVYVNREFFDVRGPSAGESPAEAGDIEQVFGKPLRVAGAALADQKSASVMMMGKWLKAPNPTDEAKVARDRDALRKIADVGIEILIAPSNAALQETSTGKKSSATEIQATAIRLEDAKIIGQASTANLQWDGHLFKLSDASEALALLLMQDLIREAK